MAQQDPNPTKDDRLTPRALTRAMVARRRGRVILVTVVRLIATAAEVAVPVAIGWSVDRVLDATEPGSSVGLATSLVIAVAVIAAVLAVAAVGLSVQAHYRVGLYIDARLWIERQLTHRVFSRRGGVDRAPGTLLSLAANDSRRTGDTIDVSATALTSLTSIALILGWLAWVEPLIGVAALLGTVLVAVVITPLGKPLAERSEIERAKLAEATAALSDSMIGLGQAKGLRAEPTLRWWFRGRSSAIRASATAQAEAQARIFAIMVATPIVVLLPALWLAARELIDETMTVGQFVTALALTQFLQWPVMNLGQAFETFVQGRASAGRITSVLAAPSVLDAGDTVVEIGSIQHFRVTGLDEGGHVTIPAGELVGIDLGDPGIGTAIAATLARRQAPTDGVTVEIVADNGAIDLGRWALDDLARRVTYVDAGHPWLPSGPLREAVALANPAASDDACRRAINLAAAEELLAHADGLDRRIGERGLQLSGGQRQRVAVAQALLADAELLILVEPTSALDTVTEARLAERLGRERSGRPTLVFTTSSTVLAHCDTVVSVSRRRPSPEPVA